MLCSAIMQAIHRSISSTSTVRELRALLHSDEPAVAIYDVRGRLVGVVRREVGGEMLRVGDIPVDHHTSCRIETLLTHELITCFPDDNVEQARELMRLYGVRCLGVVDRAGMAIGMVELRDVADLRTGFAV